MNRFIGELPTASIKLAVSALNDYRKELAKLREQRKECEASDALQKYSQGHIEKELVRITTETAQIMQEAAAKVRSYHDNAVNSLAEAYAPVGSDVSGATNEADAALFEKGLILDAKTLEYIISKHDNPAFRIMAAKYAKERNWDGFEYETGEAAAKDYINQVFSKLAEAATDPFGYSAIQYTETKGEYGRIADAYGLVAEFNKGGGDSIDSAVLSESLGDSI